MISRYAPTYQYADLFRSLNRSRENNIEKELIKKLQQLYQVKHIFLLESGKISISVLLKAYADSGTVLTPAYNCIAVPEAAIKAGYGINFVDTRPDRLNVEVEDFFDAITPDVNVLMPVHLFGIPWRVDKFLDHYGSKDLLLVEDAAPAFGAKLNGKMAGAYGDAAIISFHWTKPLSAETGGALLTNNDDLAKRVQKVLANAITPRDRWSLFLRTWLRKTITKRGIYSLTRRGHSLLFGQEMYEIVPKEQDPHLNVINKMSPFAAALVLEQINRLDEINASRQAIADIYHSLLDGAQAVVLPDVPEISQPSWIQYPILVDNKEAFYQHMQKHNIDVTWSYRYSCPETYSDICCTNSNQIAKSIIGLPTYPTLTHVEAKRIGKIAAEFLNS